ARYGLLGTPVLLTFGRMDASEKAKGFDEVLEAMPALLREFPRLVYCLAGDGSDRARLMAKAENLGVQSRVAFPGYVPESDKAALFRAADVYVMPGRLEGFGYVFLEALAAGTPVIGSTLDASREAMMDGKWGIVVDPADQGALIDAIRSSIFSPQVPERMELEYFSKRQFLTRMHDMLNRVLDA
ncbi:MAG TPA: glycosyltransferase, partial [Gemmatimonadaceae bacterium]